MLTETIQVKKTMADITANSHMRKLSFEKRKFPNVTRLRVERQGQMQTGLCPKAVVSLPTLPPHIAA